MEANEHIRVDRAQRHGYIFYSEWIVGKLHLSQEFPEIFNRIIHILHQQIRQVVFPPRLPIFNNCIP